jgi:hypothetical protein
MVFIDDHDRAVFVATTAFDADRGGAFAAGESVTFSVTLDCVFRPGRYQPAAIVAVHHDGQEVIDRWERAVDFIVSGSDARGGLVDVPHRIAMERETRSVEAR